MKPLSVRLFGPFEAKYNDVPLKFSSAKLRALFAYLLLEVEQPHTRDTLAELLWEGFEPKKARTNLRLSLSRLRKHLEPFLSQLSSDQPLLTVDRDQIQLHPLPDGLLQVDAWQLDQTWFSCERHPHETLLRCYHCMEKLREAIRLYQGELLVDMGVDDTEAFDNWRTTLQEQYHIKIIELLDVLTEYALQIGNWKDALHLASRHLQWEPWSERAFQQLMKSLAGMGDVDGVSQQYQRCCQALDEQLGATPLPETTALYERLIQEGSAIPQPSMTNVHLRPQRLSFVGREEELIQIRALLLDPLYRLVTLHGPGGSGKTRLASAAVQSLGSHFPDGIWFVPLDGITSREDSQRQALVEAIAAAIECPLRGADPPEDQILRYIKDKEILLLLDNYEGLVATGPLLAAWLDAAPQLRLLVTSRERLELDQEQAFGLDGLPVPEEPITDPARLRGFSGVELFVERAQQHPEGFDLTEDTAEDVSWLCRLVRGIPLAIELAASWLGTMDLSEAREKLQQGVGLTQDKWLDKPPRHRSMEAVFQTSWELLSPAAQQQLKQLAVFRGPFGLEAAQHIAGASAEALDDLLAKSLLQQEPDDRWSLHPLLREFLWQQHDETSANQLTETHATYFLGWLRAQQQAFFDSRSPGLRRQALGCLQDLYGAWSWAVTHREIDLLASSLTALARFCQLQCLFIDATRLLQEAIDGISEGDGSDKDDDDGHENTTARYQLQARLQMYMVRFLEMMGQIGESAAQGEQLQKQLEETNLPPSIQAEAHHALGATCRRQGKIDDARSHFEQALALATEADDKPTMGVAMYGLAIAAFSTGQPDQAEEHVRNALALFESLDMVMDQGAAYNILGLLGGSRGQRDVFKRECSKALDLYESIDYAFGQKVMYCNLGYWYEQNGEYEEAERLYRKTLLADRRLGDRVCQVITAGNLANTFVRSGNYEEADALLAQILLVARDIGDKQGEIWSLIRSGWSCWEGGALDEALDHLNEARDLAEAMGQKMLLAEIHFHLGNCLREQGELAAAIGHFDEALAANQALSRAEIAQECALLLAQCELSAGDKDKALERLEEIWPDIPDQIHKGVHRPVALYLIAHDIFQAHDDPRAEEVVKRAQTYLQDEAAKLPSEETKELFLEAIPAHQKLIALSS